MKSCASRFFLIFSATLASLCGHVASADEEGRRNASNVLANVIENDIYSTLYRPFTLEDLTDDLRNWTPPEFFTKNYPCYLSGFDYEDRPIWAAELGKFDMLKLVNMGPEVLKEFEKYCRYAGRLWTDSHTLKNPDVHSIVLLLDFEGLRLIQYAQPPTIRFLLKLARNYVKLFEEHLDYAIVINANYVTETLINIVRPVFGNLIARAEIYGNDKSKWLPRLLRHFPRESLPEWYGGYGNFTPIQVIG